MEYLIEKFNQTYSWLSSYYYGEQKKNIQDITKLTPQQKIILLRKILKQQCIYSEQMQGKLQMQFTKLIQVPAFKKFCFTTQLPYQYPTKKQPLDKKLICFFGEYFFQSENIKCPLIIQVLFEQNSIKTLPKLYVKNPILPVDTKGQKLLRTARPNRQFVKIIQNKNQTKTKMKYKACTDGIEIILQEKDKDWKLDVKILIDEGIQMMRRQFPFVKMKQPVVLIDFEANIDQQTKKTYQNSVKLKQCLYRIKQKKNQEKSQNELNQVVQNNHTINQLPQLINMIQQIDILYRAQQSYYRNMKMQTQNILKIKDQMHRQCSKLIKQDNVRYVYPEVDQSDPLRKQLFQIFVDKQATQDCLVQLERFIKDNDKQQHKVLDQNEFKKALNVWQLINQKIFFQRYKIKQLIKFIQQQQKNQP